MKVRRVKPRTTQYIPCYVYFVGYREVHRRNDVTRVRNMILRVPGPIRDVSAVGRLETMLADAAEKREREDAAGPAVVGTFLCAVTILTLSLLEVFQQELTPEEVALIEQRNAEAAKTASPAPADAN